MAISYIEAIGLGFPGVQCHASGDGKVYNSIVWEGGLPLPSKQTLDEWISSNTAIISDTRITVLAFRNRFTRNEKIAIEFASIDNPNAPIEQRQMSAALRVSAQDLSVASYVDLQDPETIAGVQVLETFGIIGPGRAAEILSTAILPTERP